MKLEEYLKTLNYEITEEDATFVTELCAATRCRLDPNRRYGWESPFLFLAISKYLQPKTFLEFGTGRATTSILMALQPSIKTIHTYDIVPHTQEQKTWYNFQEVYMPISKFVYNVLGTKLERNKIHFHCGNTSIMEADEFPQVPGGYDLIYIDGSHDFMPVVKDFKNALKLVSPTGWIIFDDYKHSLPGVRQAVDNFVKPFYKTEIVSLCGHIFMDTPEPDDEGHIILRMDKQKESV